METNNKNSVTLTKARRPLPDRLRAAYDWTDAAGELDTLCGLDDEAAETYADESEANAREHGEADVAAADLIALRLWLRDQRGPITVSDTEECTYCFRGVRVREGVPALDDDGAWADLAAEHARGCEWIATRAHRRDA